MTAIEFADIADPYQANADLHVYAAAGYDRILFKSTEGVGYLNPRLGDWWRQAGALGLARGAYHFARPSLANGTDEANHFANVLDAVGGIGPRDWAALDIEELDARNQPAVGAHAYVVAFTAQMIARGYVGGVVYSYADYLTATGLRPAHLPPGWQWLHLANYAAAPDTALPLPVGWGRDRVLARQYTDSAPTVGISTSCDRSRVLREWLPTEADMPAPSQWTAADWTAFTIHAGPAIAKSVHDFLWAQVKAPTGDPQNPIPAQPNLGKLLSSDYNHDGNTLAEIRALKVAVAALLPPGHPVAAALAATDGPLSSVQIAALTDPAVLAQLGEAITGRLAQLATTTATTTKG